MQRSVFFCFAKWTNELPILVVNFCVQSSPPFSWPKVCPKLHLCHGNTTCAWNKYCSTRPLRALLFLHCAVVFHQITNRNAFRTGTSLWTRPTPSSSKLIQNRSGRFSSTLFVTDSSPGCIFGLKVKRRTLFPSDVPHVRCKHSMSNSP